MKNKVKTFDNNLSPVDWYIASYLLRFEVIGEKKEKPNSRYSAWENTIIIKAVNPEEAYKKAVKKGKSEAQPYKNTDGVMVQFIFEGLTSLNPIYEELEDGAEISWTEHEGKALKTIRGWTKKKKELEAFED